MLGSMYSAVSGLSAHQTKMNVIGNNIANVNTYGFKASRVTFSDVFYQTINGASAPTTNGGGTNPTQLGYGAKVSSIDVINTRAGSATTDRALDVYINGDGYLPVKTGDGVVKYTRVGVLSFDLAGNLVDRNGNQVLGFRLDETTKNAQLNSDGTSNVQNLVGIKVDPSELDKYTGIAIGQNGEVTAIKEGDPTLTLGSGTSWVKTSSLNSSSLYKGSVTISSATPSANVKLMQGKYTDGTAFTGTISFPAGADIQGPVTIGYDGTDVVLSYKDKSGASKTITGTEGTPGDGDYTFSVPDISGGTATVAVEVDATGADGVKLPATGTLTLGTVVPDSVAVTLTTTNKAGTPVTINGTVTLNGDTATLTAGDITLELDSAAFGSLDFDDLKDTVLGTAGPGAGKPEKIAHIAAVKFTNPDGLSQDGESYYVETTNSGEAVATTPGSGGTGNFLAGSLEMSNVDLSREFTEMIITQRGFQANTRMITVSDEMLSELVNMKR
ncbi:flagellar hook-basal body complex protein [Anoxybacterium hadale]|uniref:Flagellar hook-basal body complex protein n=1 Tax=Anoxybacterium hadale TaxID=3408580 RepID=A0ACD1AC92_9FIRM|nr:flagellar hook-basal body complex protein [Clostridiales bacterium]